MSHKKLRQEVDLPADLWEIVAAHLSLQEWARASGTCRSTRGVRLKNVTIKALPAAGVQWASRVLDGAKAVCSTAQNMQQVADCVSSGLCSIKGLQQLIIDGPAFSDVAPFCLSWVLAQACKLEVLVTPVGIMPWLPLLANLKHLQVTFHRDAGNFCDAVRTCTALQTLSLHCQGETGSNVLRMDELDLNSLLHLRVFVLKAIALDGIKVPKACQVHIGVPAETDMQGNDWQGIPANIHGIDASIRQSDASSLQSYLNKAFEPLQNLRTLILQVCVEHLVLDLQTFGRVDKLRISGKDLRVCIPAGASWDALDLDATSKLELYFEDLKGFPRAVPRFAARFKFLYGNQVLELCTALARKGIKFTYCLHALSLKSMLQYPAGHRPFECWCGACLDCLVVSGQAVSPA